MAVESKLHSEKIESKKNYPYLGKASSGKVVMFTGNSCGFVVEKGIGHDPIGFYSSTGWDEKEFTPLSPYESITLRNV